MDAMEYETLIRMAHNCGRGGVEGADTYYYNQMEMLENNLDSKTIYATDEERQAKYIEAFAVVRHYVKNAILASLERLKYNLDESDKNDLTAFMQTLHHRMTDKNVLDDIIAKANDIFIKYGLLA